MTRVTDAGWTELARVKELRELYLDRTKIGDAALREIAKLRNLEILTLCGTNITNKGLIKTFNRNAL
jgi:hypothetical protein